VRSRTDRSTRSEPPVVYLIGTAGHPNYGDELITAGWLRHLARVMPDAEVWLDTPRPGQSAVLFSGLHPGLRCVDTLFHGCWNAPTDSPEDTIAFGRRVVTEPGLLPREATAIEGLARVDLVHILGGGYVTALWPKHLALVGAARAMATEYNARTVLTGAGLTPLVPGSQAALAAELARFDVVDVRDVPSHQALAGRVAHATVTGDDALVALGGSHAFGAEGAVRTMLSLQSDHVDVPLDELADYVVRTLRAWGVAEEPVTLVECLPPDDFALLPLLRPHLPGLQLLPFSRLWHSGFPAGPGQRWISTRFHSHLMAAAAGAWGVAVPVSADYYRTKHESLVRLGSGWSLAEDFVSPVPLGTAPAAPFGGRLPELRAAKRKVADHVARLAAPGR
jgi:hypothetical protein